MSEFFDLWSQACPENGLSSMLRTSTNGTVFSKEEHAFNSIEKHLNTFYKTNNMEVLGKNLNSK